MVKFCPGSPLLIESIHMHWVRSVFVAGVVGSMMVVMAALAFLHLEVGALPFEVLHRAERRLEGHPRLQWAVEPVLVALRWLDLQSRGQPDTPGLGDLSAIASAAPREVRTDHFNPPVWVQHQGDRRRVRNLAEAAARSVDGDVVVLGAGTHVTQGGVWRDKSVRFTGEGGVAWLVAQSPLAEGKALLVLSRGQFEVSHLAFVGARVADRNGAGIRFEGGHLKVSHCVFKDSESGILIQSDEIAPTSELHVSESEFSRLGDGVGYAHAVYAGRIRLIELRGNHFHHGRVGHLIKSRAQESRLIGNRITDEAGGQASYELNFPNGGLVVLKGNVIAQSRTTRNGAVLSMMEEGNLWSRNALYAVHNTFVNLHPMGGRFLQVEGELSDGWIGRNVVIGRGVWRIPDGVGVGRNLRVGLSEVNPARDGEWLPATWQSEWVPDDAVGRLNGQPLTLDEVYQHPHQIKRLVPGQGVRMGAVQ